MQSPNLSTRLRSIIINIDLLHKCKEETILDRQLRQMATENPEMSKLRWIERSVVGYDTSANNIEILNNQEDSNIKDEILFDPCTIIRSRFHNTKLVDEAMLHLYLKGSFNVQRNESQNDIGILNYNNDKHHIRPANENDDNLIKLWQDTIALWKKIEQTSENFENNHAFKYANTSRKSNYTPSQSAQIINETELLQEISRDLNNEQKKIFLLVCDHRQRNNPSNPDKPSQLLIHLGGAGGTGKLK